MNPKENVMYILVNTDLKMRSGKIGAQCAHSACEVVRILEGFSVKPIWYSQWLKSGHAKIVLKCDEKSMRMIIEEYEYSAIYPNDKWCIHTIDQGRTQVEPDSLTTIAFRPMAKESTPEFITHMKLL